MLRVAAAIVLGLSLLSGRVLAAAGDDPPPLVPDRPSRTFSARALATGYVQNEFGYLHDRTGDQTLDELGDWYFRWGMVRDMEVYVDIGGMAWRAAEGSETVHGWTDGGLGFRWTSQHGAGARPTAGLILNTTQPTGASAFGADTLQPEAIIAMEWRLGGRVGLGSNLAWSWRSEGGERYQRWWGSLELAVAVGERFVVFGEFYGYDRERPDGPATGYLNLGGNYRVSSSVALDARVGAGLNGVDEDWSVGVGAVVRSAGP